MSLFIESTQQLKSWRSAHLSERIGFVPTMGALHDGHAELLKKARAENDLVVLSIFVNPTQFNNAEDLQKYPKTLEGDMKIAADCKVDVVFFPQYAEIYADNYRYKVSESAFSNQLCGAHRPGHFDGVLTVVMKLLNLVQPNKAYFGEKDYQQLQLIKDMVSNFFMPVEIVPVATVREESGLAMSSRNLRLTPEQHEQASKIYQTITHVKSAADARKQLEALGFIVDYVEDHQDRRYVAASIGNVRLIDNVRI